MIKQTQSSKRMQEIQPELKALKREVQIKRCSYAAKVP